MPTDSGSQRRPGRFRRLTDNPQPQLDARGRHLCVPVSPGVESVEVRAVIRRASLGASSHHHDAARYGTSRAAGNRVSKMVSAAWEGQSAKLDHHAEAVVVRLLRRDPAAAIELEDGAVFMAHSLASAFDRAPCASQRA